jgi:DNA gyrase inhibitor GyrI
MNLNEHSTTITFPVCHYIYVEKKDGPLPQSAKQAWHQLCKYTDNISKYNHISGYMSLYKIEPQMIYRAGVVVDSEPTNNSVPPECQYMKFEGGKYAKFVSTGSYSNLPDACKRVFEIIEQSQLPIRDDFYIEHYVSDGKTTPEDQLVTEILVPTKN